MSNRWLKNHRKDGYYRKAKKEGYRARSAYKLQQIQKKFRVLGEGDFVADLGCAPGGWLQVCLELVGPEGTVLGIDLDRIIPIEGVNFIRGDMTDEATLVKVDALLETLGRKKKMDAVISDMSPDITGHYSMDHANSIYLCEMAFDFASRYLQPGGNFVCKMFQGDLSKEFSDKVRENYGYVRHFSPSASRKSSSEMYVIGLRKRK